MSVLAALFGLALALPAFTAPVVDEARRVPDDVERSVSAELIDYERRTGNEVAVAVIATTGNASIEDYANDLGEEWKPGSGGRDNGVVVVIALDDRRARIEVGDGLQGDLTDAEAGRIVRDRMVPLLAGGDVGEAVRLGTRAVREALGDDQVGTLPPVAENTEGDDGGATPVFPLLVIGLFALSMVGGQRRRSFGGGVPIFWGGGGFGGGGGGGGGGGFSGGGGGGGFSGGGASGSW
ncbi:MAG TPA: TPM domain-containing protein [Acidimicrobiales bacterium]|nr:TPM domain-containing protein [Acidimicrobiales bacterium]